MNKDITQDSIVVKNEQEFTINGKNIYQDIDGKWITQSILTEKEKTIALQHINNKSCKAKKN